MEEGAAGVAEQQFELLAKLVEGATVSREPTAVEAAARSSSEPRGKVEARLKLTKLSDADDVEAYLTTFECVTQVYKTPKERCVCKLSPQLTGRAQQAYAAMPTVNAGKYDDVKAAILLRRYDIN